ncbi:MAG: type III polyketide synthase [Planctomycetota bacterium]|nr:type III polyketide synthase [Planctomycetota bacterium]
MTSSAQLLGIGTASPGTELTAEASLGLARKLSPGEDAGRLGALHAHSGVSRRGSVLTDSGDREDLFVSGDGKGPTTATRLARYREAAGVLASAASRDALAASEVLAERVTHLITVSCTGADSPGLTHDLIDQLGLSAQVSRTHVGFMGCHGAINGLAVGSAFVAADPEAIAMVVCAEVCSLHYHIGGRWDQQVANAIFADGAACAIVGRRPGKPVVRAFGSRVFPKTRDLMSWTIGDHGFAMRLSPRVPVVLRRHVREWLEPWLAGEGLGLADISGWAVHPGGRDILEAVRLGLGLPGDALADSRAVLDGHGNMSSATVLWVIDALLGRVGSGPIAALAFGPGVSGEAMLLHVPET